MNNFYTNEKDIIAWLEKYEVKNYNLVPDDKYGFIVNVSGDVNLNNEHSIFIPVKFSKVDGDFSCCNNKLTNLEFCPSYVGGIFDCNNNKLTSLEFCPSSVGKGFDCSDNELKTLEFCPESISDFFYCNNNKLSSLEFCPSYVGGCFDCTNNPDLKEDQKIRSFKEIYSIHKKLSVELFSDKLDNSLNHVETEKKSNKIKI